MLSPEETLVLTQLLARAGASPPCVPHASNMRPECAQNAPIATGDVVQIQPLADRTFGGMLVQVCQTTPYELRGFLLRPHRGGCREAWLRLTYPEVERIGRVQWPDPEFARRCEWRTPGCSWAR